MNPHLEAAARALAGTFWDGAYDVRRARPRDDYIEIFWCEFVPDALAALRAMREVPASEAMYLAWLACYGNYVHSEDDLRTQASDTWRALLGAIVDQGGE